MELIITLVFIMACAFLTGVAMKHIRKLAYEVSLLPERLLDPILGHPLTGVSVKGVIPVPKHLENRLAIVMVASPTCGACHTELENLLKLHKQQPVPFVVFVETHEQEAYEEFMQKYQHVGTLLPAPDEMLMKLNITESPYMFIIDGNTVIRRVESPMNRLVANFRKMQLEAEKLPSGQSQKAI